MLSPDGAWVWNGREWVPNAAGQPQRSPDGAYYWNGREWVPTGVSGQPAPVRYRKEPTAWTRPLQLAVIGLTLLGDLNLVLLMPYLLDYIRLSIRRSIDLSLASQPPQENAEQVRAQVLGMTDQLVVGMLALMVLFGIGWFVLILFGTLKRWTWFYWLLLVIFGLSVLGLPQQVLQVFGFGAYGGAGLPAFVEPLPVALIGLFLVLVQVALFVWMIIAYRRYGPWACRRVPIP